MRISTKPFLILLCSCATLLPAIHTSRADDLLDDKGLDTVLEDTPLDAASPWWNKDWKYRRQIQINDPALVENPEAAVLLAEPEPLLLYNTGKSSDKGADLRAVNPDGELLKCGVTNFGRDDGSSHIWCVPKLRAGQKTIQFTVYYGNPAAKATGNEIPDHSAEGDPQFIHLGVEQLQPGDKAPDVVQGSFFHNLIVAEAETFEPENGAGKDQVKVEEVAAASGEKLLTEAPKATPLLRTVQVPEAGSWYLHVRYKNPDNKQHYGPFKLQVGEQTFVIGAKPDEGAPFSWQSMPVQLAKGELKLALRLDGPAAPDTILLTRDAHYKPDIRDINGPVWMRFKVTSDNIPPFYIDLFGYYITTSVNGYQGKTAAYLFHDRTVMPKRGQFGTDNGGIVLTSQLPSYLAKLPQDKSSLLVANEWSPWGQALAHGSYTWFSQIRFIPGGKVVPPKPHDLKVDCLFSTRPDASRIYHATSIPTGTLDSFNVHMPPSLDLATLRSSTLSFEEWAMQRYEIAQSLGFKGGEGPKQIVASTMATSFSSEDARTVLKTLDAIGLNTSTFGAQSFDVDPQLATSSLKYWWDFFRTEYKFDEKYFYKPDPEKMDVSPTGASKPHLNPVGKLPGLTATQTVEKIVADATDASHRKETEAFKKRSPWQYAHMRYNDLDDEIGPAVDGNTINRHPLFKAYFVEYLQAHHLDPDFFGVKTWDELQAVDYQDLSKEEKRLELLKNDADAAAKKLEETADAPMGTGDPDGLGQLDDPVKENEKKAQEAKKRQKLGMEAHERPAPTATEKRAYYWTQKFRSHYTAWFYHCQTAAIHKYFPAGIKTCANMQADPIQAGKMWDGGLNIWDLGRDNAFSAMQLEDWDSSTVNVSFGMNMERAAARKNNQPMTALVVGANAGRRIVADMSQGTRHFLFYLYGPIQGDPAFAEDRESLRQIGLGMRQLGRAENDILASKNRPCEAAILIDVASEVNRKYYEYPFDHDRMSIYAALNDAQVPVDLVGSDEVLEDNALSRYKVLYVCDPHVQAKVQDKIKAWVAAGGTLWADYAGLGRQEYDQPSTLMDEVFGLKSRGAINPYSTTRYNGVLPEGVAVKVPHSDLFSGEEITGLRFSQEAKTSKDEPQYEVSTAKVMATFADGKPAIIRNKFGKGEAVLNGMIAGLSYGGQWAPHTWNFSRIAREAPATPLRGELMTSAAKMAGLKPFVKIDEHMFWANVHDGPDQCVVYLMNDQGALKAKPLEVTLTKPAKSVYLASGRPVTFTANGNQATVPLTLPADECDILVFKY